MTLNLKFIHVGHHKCGSTFLQYEVIPKIKALKQPPGKLPDGTSNLAFRRAWISIASQIEGAFDFENVKREFEALDFNCLSNEAFVGFGATADNGPNVRMIAERLRRLAGETWILIVIRNQKRTVPSLYLDSVEKGYVGSFQKWVEGRAFHYSLDWYRFAPLIDTYRSVFGNDRVRVVLFEDLFRRDTVAGILETFGVPPEGLDDVDFARRVNRSPSALQMFLSRIVFRHIGTPVNGGNGRAYRYWERYIGPLSDRVWDAVGGGPPKLDFPGYSDILQTFFHADNKRASEMIGVDLAAKGYP